MKIIHHVIRPLALTFLLAARVAVPSVAQEVSIPDPALNTVIRETLPKPTGPLLQSDLLALTNLTAISRNITNLQGLEAARNLNTLVLDDNHITDRFFPDVLTNLTSLSVLDLSENLITNLTLPGTLTNLTSLRVDKDQLAQVTFPAAGLTRLTNLSMGFNRLTSLVLPADMTNLSLLSVFQNLLTNVTLPPRLANLMFVNFDGNHLARLSFPGGMTNLGALIAGGNQLTSFAVPAGMRNLGFLRLDNNQLTSFTLPAGLTNLTGLFLDGNQLTNLALPSDLHHLTQLRVGGNQLTKLTLPSGLTALTFLNLTANQLTNITLPPDMQGLVGLFLGSNALTSFVLSEPLAATGMASVVDALQNQGIPVFTHPLETRLVRPAMFAGAFKFGITGPPGVYTVLASSNLVNWSVVNTAANPLGGVNFRDADTNPPPRKFYRAVLQVPPANMVFIAPNTFVMGSPTNELHHRSDESPQTTVTLTRGFWMGIHEVTQREFLEVTGTNPSSFPGDLDRPVESVSWPAATNYCWQLTQRELAAGRISPGSQYRLPTEAEWECAARAGTATRFSYGDDLDYSGLPNYAWQSVSDGLTTHPVGLKLPNPWGLYDMYGNVMEWCQDWLGPLPGGSVADPQGVPSNVIGDKVARGGAFDFGGSFCRSASRFGFGNHPALTDWNLGFRVVLVTGP